MVTIDIREKPRVKDAMQSLMGAFGFNPFDKQSGKLADGRYAGKWFGSTVEFMANGIEYSVHGPTNFVNPRDVSVVIVRGMVRMEVADKPGI